jgi:hypothetical protein
MSPVPPCWSPLAGIAVRTLLAVALAAPGSAAHAEEPDEIVLLEDQSDEEEPRIRRRTNPRTLPDGLPPATIPLGDVGEVRFGLMGQIQVASDLVPEVPTARVRFRRLRADTRLQAFDDKVRFRSTLNLAPGDLDLIELWVEGRPVPGVVGIRLGVLKVPFTTSRDISFSQLPLVEWSPVTRAFGSERQLGLMVHAAVDDWHMAISVTQAQNTRQSHGLAVADAVGADTCGATSLTDPCAFEGVAPEIVVRAGWAHEGVDLGNPVNHGRFPTGAVAVSAAVDTDPDRDVDLAARVALESTFGVRRLALHTAGYLGAAVADDGTWVPAFGRALAELVWSAHRHLHPALRASGVWVLPSFRADRRAAGEAADTLELAGGVTVPLLGSDVRMQVDGYALHRPTPTTSTTSAGLRFLLQAGF